MLCPKCEEAQVKGLKESRLTFKGDEDKSSYIVSTDLLVGLVGFFSNSKVLFVVQTIIHRLNGTIK